MLGYGGRFITDAFCEDSVAADLLYLQNGIHIVYGTVGSLSNDVFEGKYTTPFVFRSAKGDMAVGGLRVKSGDMAKNYIVSAVLSQVEKNRKDGKRSLLNPVFADPDGRNFLVVTAVDPEEDPSLVPLEDIEEFVRDWVSGTPGDYL